MGIKELGKFVREEGIDCEFELELTFFSGTAWGIDTPQLDLSTSPLDY